MDVIGFGVLGLFVPLVVTALLFVVGYLVVRRAVRDGILDAQRESAVPQQRPTPWTGPYGPTPPAPPV